MKIIANMQAKAANYKALDSKDKKTYWKEFFLNNALYFLLIIAVIYTYTQNPRFLSANSIINIISLSAANIPIACGIAGCIVLTGTDLSAGRVVGLTACISASLLWQQNVSGLAGISHPSGYPDRNGSRWYSRLGEWILCSEVSVTSFYCNPGNPVDRLWYPADVYYAERK